MYENGKDFLIRILLSNKEEINIYFMKTFS